MSCLTETRTETQTQTQTTQEQPASSTRTWQPQLHERSASSAPETAELQHNRSRNRVQNNNARRRQVAEQQQPVGAPEVQHPQTRNRQQPTPPQPWNEGLNYGSNTRQVPQQQQVNYNADVLPQEQMEQRVRAELEQHLLEQRVQQNRQQQGDPWFEGQDPWMSAGSGPEQTPTFTRPLNSNSPFRPVNPEVWHSSASPNPENQAPAFAQPYGPEVPHFEFAAEANQSFAEQHAWHVDEQMPMTPNVHAHADRSLFQANFQAAPVAQLGVYNATTGQMEFRGPTPQLPGPQTLNMVYQTRQPVQSQTWSQQPNASWGSGAWTKGGAAAPFHVPNYASENIENRTYAA